MLAVKGAPSTLQTNARTSATLPLGLMKIVTSSGFVTVTSLFWSLVPKVFTSIQPRTLATSTAMWDVSGIRSRLLLTTMEWRCSFLGARSTKQWRRRWKLNSKYRVLGLEKLLWSYCYYSEILLFLYIIFINIIVKKSFCFYVKINIIWYNFL